MFCPKCGKDFLGTDVDAAGEAPSYDASDAGIIGAFVAALHDYLERELKYESTDTYHPSADIDWPVGLEAQTHQRRTGLRACGQPQSEP